MRNRRRSIRLKGYDYSRDGAYFITMCAQNRKCLFGNIVNGEMQFNDAGRIVMDEWEKSAVIRQELELDEYIIMPNHLHGIVLIVNDRRGDGLECHVGAHGHAPLRRQPKSIGSFVAGFKSAVTKRINISRGTPGEKIWQRNYYEHIIRNDDEFNRIREYILFNPAQWEKDHENPFVKVDCDNSIYPWKNQN